MQKLIELPGLVDVHVHLREPGATQKEDFETGTKAAIAGGYTQIIDMPNNTPSTTSPSELEKKFKLAKKRIWCDVGFNFGGTPESTKYFKKIKNKVFGLKIYMNQTTGTLLQEKTEDRNLIFKAWESSHPIMVHAEGETVEVAINLAKKHKKALHVCHITGDQIEIIKKAKKSGLEISCEVCPHHLFLTKADEKKLGSLGLMKPRLLDKKLQKKLWDNLEHIDMISTDHAPHTLEEKFSGSEPKYGVPGLETTVPLMMKAVAENRITIEKLTQMLCTNARNIFKLPGQEKTFVIIDTSKKIKIGSKKLFTKSNWSPFKFLEGRGEVRQVVIRGKTIYKDGVFAKAPNGITIKPTD